MPEPITEDPGCTWCWLQPHLSDEVQHCVLKAGVLVHDISPACCMPLQDMIPTEVQGSSQGRTPPRDAGDSDSEPSVGFLTPPDVDTQLSQLIEQVSRSADQACPNWVAALPLLCVLSAQCLRG